MTTSLPTGRPADRLNQARALTGEDASAATSAIVLASRAQSFSQTSFQRGDARALLSDRDFLVLQALDALRLLTTVQIQRICLSDGSPLTQARRTRALLQRLTERKLVVRLERRVGGVRAGSSGFVYGLSGHGQAAIGVGGVHGGKRRRVWEVKPAFLNHVLAVADVYTDLLEASRRSGVELLAFQAEPAAWRIFLGASGKSVTLKPDGYVRLGIGDIERNAFLEVDLATESLTTIARKCGVYASYFRSGIEQAAHGVFPLVSWLTTTEHRASRIASAIKRLPTETHRLFDVALLEAAVSTLTSTARGGSMA